MHFHYTVLITNFLWAMQTVSPIQLLLSKASTVLLQGNPQMAQNWHYLFSATQPLGPGEGDGVKHRTVIHMELSHSRRYLQSLSFRKSVKLLQLEQQQALDPTGLCPSRSRKMAGNCLSPLLFPFCTAKKLTI